jgi:tetratricopeptide (TPR) repeat protein
VLAGTAVYWNSLSGPFVFDDTVSIVENAYLLDWSHHLTKVLLPERELPASGRPLPALSFAINYAIGGLDVRGYHALNLALHLWCALLLFGIVRRTLELSSLLPRFGRRSTDLAFAAALLWTLHPLNTEVVDYVTERMESMMALFYFLTVYSSVRAHRSTRQGRWHLTAVLSSILGMLCKESMATAPVIIVLFDRIFVFESFTEAFRKRWRLYAGLMMSWLVLPPLMWSGPRMRSTGFSIGLSPWTYMLNQTVVISHYLLLTIWPRALVLMYGPTRPLTLGDVWPYALFITSLSVVASVALIKAPKLGFLGAWFFITLAPASSIVPILTEVGAERRMYLPLAALMVLAVVGTALLWDRAKQTRTESFAPAFALLAVCASASALTITRNREYSSPLRLAETVLERWPTGLAHRMVGTESILAGRQAEGVAHLRDAVRLGEPRAPYDLGIALFNEGKLDESIQQLQAFVREEPDLLEVISARMTTGRAFVLQQHWPQAIGEFRTLLAMAPSNLEARLRLADALAAHNEFEEAIGRYREYLKARPADTEGLTKLAIALVATGRHEDAIVAFRRVVELDPQSADAQRNLATALYDKRNFDEAAAHAGQAVALKPNDPLARDLFGRILALQGKFDEARKQFERALQIDPGFQDARDHLQRIVRLGGVGPVPTPPATRDRTFQKSP